MNYLLRLTPSNIQIRGMAHPDSMRHPLFLDDYPADWTRLPGSCLAGLFEGNFLNLGHRQPVL